MTQAILNPVKFPSPLLPAEIKLASCLANGEPCLVGNGELPCMPITHDDSGNLANVVRAEVICFFAFGGDREGGKHLVRGPSIALRGAWICGKDPLDLMHTIIPYALHFSNCHFTVNVSMSNMECAALYLDGAHLAQGLDADRLKTKGNVHLRDGFLAKGKVLLMGANIGGNLDCNNGKFVNPDGIALAADGMATRGSVYLRHGFSAEGEVRLLGANIVGDLDCERGNFNNLIGNALTTDGITVKGDVSLRKGFSAKGVVRFSGARIGGDMNCFEGEFFSREKNEPALVADDARISGALWWRGTTGRGVVNLGHARADVLADDIASWKSFEVILDGFTYSRFSHPANAKLRIKWIENRPCPKKWDIPSFSPLPYEQAAKVLFGTGHTREARKILLRKERTQTLDNKLIHPIRKIGRMLWDDFAGYGYRLRRTLYWMLGFVLFGAFLFNFADDNGRMVPHQPLILTNEQYKEATIPPCVEFKCPPEKRPTEVVKCLFPDYPEFNAFIYSLDVFIPFFALHQEQYWYPNPSDIDREILLRILPFWYWLEISFGWILTSLFLLSATGLLRPRQSSGGKD